MLPPDLPFLPTHPDHRRRVPDETPALFDEATGWLSYGELRAKIEEFISARSFPRERTLTLCCLPNSGESVIAYLALTSMGHSIMMAAPDMAGLDELITRYQPSLILTPSRLDNDALTTGESPFPTLNLYKSMSAPVALHSDLFLLLLTSGSTGGNKAVRLSYRNIAHNTKAIIESLALDRASRALAHLPLSYSFGLSVLHTHLATGGSCVLSDESLLSQLFWQLAREQNVTHFYGVPYHFEMIDRLGLARLKAPALTHFMQAGGKMALPLTQKIKEAVEKIPNSSLYIMYGQTEAAPRLSCFNALKHSDKLESCGQALPDQHFEIVEDEIIARGPNIMMGYAQDFSDLIKDDECKGRLTTGDLGKLDEDGFLTITGRKQHFAKLFGQRIALDDLEKQVSALAPCLAIEGAGKIIVLVEEAFLGQIQQIKNLILSHTNLQGPWVEVRTLPSFPRTSNGKIDYAALTQIAKGEP